MHFFGIEHLLKRKDHINSENYYKYFKKIINFI